MPRDRWPGYEQVRQISSCYNCHAPGEQCTHPCINFGAPFQTHGLNCRLLHSQIERELRVVVCRPQCSNPLPSGHVFRMLVYVTSYPQGNTLTGGTEQLIPAGSSKFGQSKHVLMMSQDVLVM